MHQTITSIPWTPFPFPLGQLQRSLLGSLHFLRIHSGGLWWLCQKYPLWDVSVHNHGYEDRGWDLWVRHTASVTEIEPFSSVKNSLKTTSNKVLKTWNWQRFYNSNTVQTLMKALSFSWKKVLSKNYSGLFTLFLKTKYAKYVWPIFIQFFRRSPSDCWRHHCFEWLY